MIIYVLIHHYIIRLLDIKIYRQKKFKKKEIIKQLIVPKILIY